MDGTFRCEEGVGGSNPSAPAAARTGLGLTHGFFSAGPQHVALAKVSPHSGPDVRSGIYRRKFCKWSGGVKSRGIFAEPRGSPLPRPRQRPADPAYPTVIQKEAALGVERTMSDAIRGIGRVLKSKALVALLCACVFGSPPLPAHAQSYFFSPPAGAAAGANCLTETIGADDGSGTPITASASTHTMGSYSTGQLAGAGASGVTVSAWNKFILHLGAASTATNRYLVKVSIDGGSSDYIPPFYVMPQSTAGYHNAEFKMAVPAGSDVRVAIQSSAGNATLKAAITGCIPQGSGQPAGYTVAENLLTPDTAATHPSSTSVSVVADGALTQIVPTTGQAYGAFLINLGSSTTPTHSQGAYVRLAATSSDTLIGGRSVWIASASASTPRFSMLVEAPVAVSQPLKLNIQALNPGDAIRVGLMGFR